MLKDPNLRREDLRATTFDPMQSCYFSRGRRAVWKEIVAALPPPVVQATDHMAVELPCVRSCTTMLFPSLTSPRCSWHQH